MARHRSFFSNLDHLLPVLVAGAGIIVWAYSTFALKEQSSLLMQLIEKRYDEAKAYSDKNRQGMEALFNQILDSLDRIESDRSDMALKPRRHRMLSSPTTPTSDH